MHIKSKAFLVRCSAGLHERVLTHCREEEIPVTVLIRQLLKNALRTHEEQKRRAA
jgi:hypothetical protein